MPKLTRKQKKFVDEYVATGNGTKAAKKAYDIKPNDEITPRVIASENLTKPNIVEAIQEALPDEILGQKHRALLESTTLDHMTFPLGPRDEKQREEINESRRLDSLQHNKPLKLEDGVSDEEIKSMLSDVNCKVRRIEHGEHARHVYFWAPDNRAVKDALDMAYKLKGKYAPDKHINLNLNKDIEPNERLKKLADKLNAK